jgi:hypothetical protein
VHILFIILEVFVAQNNLFHGVIVEAFGKFELLGNTQTMRIHHSQQSKRSTIALKKSSFSAVAGATNTPKIINNKIKFPQARK